jgi:hypothetical protein
MPLVRFDPTIPLLDREEIFHALDGATAVIGFTFHYLLLITKSELLNKNRE